MLLLRLQADKQYSKESIKLKINMIEKTKCSSCSKIYELTWNDSDLTLWSDDYDDDYSEEIEESFDDPVYCPFCGTHIDYDE